MPTTYLCYLVRKMYTTDEIRSRVPRLEPQDGDERLEKIKGSFLVNMMSSVSFFLLYIFMY